MISQHLKNCKFTKVASNWKNPIDNDWVNKPYTFDEANEFIKKGYNVGLLCGYNDIVAIDCDSKDFEDIVAKFLPIDTYTQKSATRGLKHYVYRCKGWNLYKTINDPTKKDNHYGEILAKGRQIVLHPSKIHNKQYGIVNDVEPKEINPEQILNLINHFLIPQIEEKIKTSSQTQQTSDVDNLNILDIISTSDLKKSSKGEYFGSNPWHGSDTGMNFWINPIKNVAYCFRCQAGIQPIKALALNEGIIKNCDDTLRGSNFKKAIEIAYEKKLITKIEGVKSSKTIIEDKPQEQEPEYLVMRNYRDFEKIKKPKDYLVKDFLPLHSLTMIYSAPGSFKTIISQQIAMCVANGKDFLGLKTKKHTILFSDKKNNDFIIKDRLSRLRKGNNIRSKDFPIYYLTRKDGDLDDKVFLSRLMATIDKHKISLLVLDTLNRHSNYEENSATDLSRLYTNVFMPLIEQNKVSIVFLHHTNKTGGYRGSGDFLGMCDLVYRVERKGKNNKVVLINEKNRMGEIEEIAAQIHFEDDSITFEKGNNETEEEKKDKFLALMEKIKEVVSDQTLKRKDFEEILKAEKFPYSLSTLKNCLGWMLRKDILYQPKRGVYKLVDQLCVDEENVNL